jgi:oligopeptidase B
MDPYGWLRDRQDPRVIAHLEEENRRTARAMRHTEPLQDSLYREMLGRLQETDRSAPVRLDGYFYYRRSEAGRQYPVWCRRLGSMDADEEVLLDANRLTEGHDFLELGVFEPSPDHRYLAYSFDTDGSEAYTLRIKDLRTGTLLPESFSGTANSAAWANDSRTLLFAQHDEAKRPHRVLRHQLGSDPASVVLVHEELDPAFYASVTRTATRQYLLIVLESAITSEVRYVEADNPGQDLRAFRARRNGIEYSVDHHEHGFLVRTNQGAENFRLMLVEPGADTEIELVPHRSDVRLDDVVAFQDHIVVTEREAGLTQVRVLDLNAGTSHRIPVSETVYSLRVGHNPVYDSRTFRYVYSSLVTPEAIVDYDMVTRQSVVAKQEPVQGGYHSKDYRTERIHAVAEDGTAIPISLVYRRDLPLDGGNPCLLTGYGAYGASLEAEFSAPVLSLLDRGFVYAIAHVRGGGELGESWHKQGKMLDKRNTFTDFVSCAEHLTRAGYTTSDRLAIRGRSAGGLLIGAVVNMRPDLFAVVVMAVPFVDVANTMLDPSIPLTVLEYEEWGDPRNPEHLDYIRSYSPYDNLKSGSYPHILVTTGLNDPRVQYWEPARWVAKLRSLKTDDNRLLLRVDLEAGHRGASGRYETLHERAFESAFLVDLLARPEPHSDDPSLAHAEEQPEVAAALRPGKP